MTQDVILNVQSNEVLAINLRRALSRLEQKILSSTPDIRLQKSRRERVKTFAVGLVFLILSVWRTYVHNALVFVALCIYGC